MFNSGEISLYSALASQKIKYGDIWKEILRKTKLMNHRNNFTKSHLHRYMYASNIQPMRHSNAVWRHQCFFSILIFTFITAWHQYSFVFDGITWNLNIHCWKVVCKIYSLVRHLEDREFNVNFLLAPRIFTCENFFFQFQYGNLSYEPTSVIQITL